MIQESENPIPASSSVPYFKTGPAYLPQASQPPRLRFIVLVVAVVLDGTGALCRTACSLPPSQPFCCVITDPATFDKPGPSIRAALRHQSVHEPAPEGVPQASLGWTWSLGKKSRFSDPKLFLLRFLAKVPSWGRTHGEKALYSISPSTRAHPPAANHGVPPPPTAQIAVPGIWPHHNQQSVGLVLPEAESSTQVVIF